MPYTNVTEPDDTEQIIVCNDCGAFAATEEEVVHHKTCAPGESAKWEKYYEEANESDT